MNSHTLIAHRDIQNWVSARKGQPAIRRVPDPTGRMRSRLELNFERPRLPTENPSQGSGLSPVSWTAWLAELDRQNLALRVSDRGQPAFEFIERHELN